MTSPKRGAKPLNKSALGRLARSGIHLPILRLTFTTLIALVAIFTLQLEQRGGLLPGQNLFAGLFSTARQGTTPVSTALPVATPTADVYDATKVNPNIGNGWQLPAMGWNHYNRFDNNVNEQLIRQVIDTMATNGMRAAGYRYINLDDSWQARDNQGHFIANQNFPSGIKSLADYAHSKGFWFGIYTSVGEQSCAYKPGSYGHIQDDVRTFAAWNIDFIKLDWCGNPRQYDAGWVRDQVRQWTDAIKVSGRPMILSISTAGGGSPWTWACQDGTVNLWRTSHDIYPKWDGEAGSILDVVNNSYLQQSSGCPGHVSDPDMLEVGNGMSADEDRSHFSLWAMLSAPLIAGNDPRNMSQETRTTLLNQEVIAIDQDPLVKQAKKVKDQNEVQYWVKPLANGAQAVLLFNSNGGAKDLTVNWKDIGLNGTYHVRDLWTHTDLGSPAGWSGHIANHGSVLVLLQP